MFNKHILAFALLSLSFLTGYSWGFFGHRVINRIAVFTLPEEMMGFYKFHIDYLTEHAVDPDKRRYSDTAEACRHYIDLDYYEKAMPIDTVPVYWKEAVAKFSEDTLKEYGIVPWHIQKMLYRLTEAFLAKDSERILHVSADIGHYIADACVPLHATMNYNGQLTGQKGIHGLWESRLPELFGNQYDLYTGRAYYINHTQEEIWKACSGSFQAKDSVLWMEKKLQSEFPSDKIYQLETKGNSKLKVYAKEYAEKYHHNLSGMVERRMRLAITLVGCLWFTAWVDAGQPDLNIILPYNNSDSSRKQQVSEELNELNIKQMIGRPE